MAPKAEPGLGRTHAIFSLAHPAYDQFAGTKNYSAVRTHSILKKKKIYTSEGGNEVHAVLTLVRIKKVSKMNT